jgi:hypothetical protein
MTYGVDAITLYKTGGQKATHLGEAHIFVAGYAQGLVERSGHTPCAFVETPLSGRRAANIASVVKQAYIGGIVRGCLASAGFHVYDVPPSTWRKTLHIPTHGASTSTLKALTRQAVAQRWPKVMAEVGDDIDLIDAAAITLHGVDQVARGAAITRSAQRSVQERGPGVVLRPRTRQARPRS